MKSCLKCGKTFLNRRNAYCSRSCANSRTYVEKFIKAVCVNCAKGITVNNRTNSKHYFCDNCKPPLKKNLKNILKACQRCSKKIYSTKRSKIKFCDNCRSLRRSEVARNNQVKILKRSKNEIYFYELCKSKYANVIHNTPMFNGWDADIILQDQKIAVLWNGKWHYQEVIKGHNRLAQIQNRDKIKIKEIISLGYTPYIIADTVKYGKENPSFVEAEFEKFTEYAESSERRKSGSFPDGYGYVGCKCLPPLPFYF